MRSRCNVTSCIVVTLAVVLNILLLSRVSSWYSSEVAALRRDNAELTRLQEQSCHVAYNELPKYNISLIWKPPTSSRQPFLTIGIPTVPRKGVDYLDATVESVIDQIPSSTRDPLFGKVEVMIVNNSPGDHPVFYELKEKYSDLLGVHFIDNQNKLEDQYADLIDPDDFNNPEDRPGKRVRRQTYDVISMLRYAQGKSRHFLFMEDDFPLCPSAMSTIYYVIRKASIYHTRWKAVRTSFGLNGIIVNGEQLEHLTAYFADNVQRKPPDLLFVEWLCGRLPAARLSDCEFPITHFTFRWNIFKHIGTVSSLRETGLDRTPGCWDDYSHLLWEIDGFDYRACADDDLWPCDYRPFRNQARRFMDAEGWGYINSYITVNHVRGTKDVAMKPRVLSLIHSEPV